MAGFQTPKQRRRRRAYTIAICGTIVLLSISFGIIALAGFPHTNWGGGGYVALALSIPCVYNGWLRVIDPSIPLRVRTYSSESVRIGGQAQIVQRETGSSSSALSAGRALSMFLIGVALLIGGTVLVAVWGHAPARSYASPAPRKVHPPSTVDRIRKATSFDEAIALAKPELTDVAAPDQYGTAASALSTYAAEKLRWADVDRKPETSVALVLKDPDLERGKRLCATGEVVEITARGKAPRKVYVGQLRTAEADLIAFVAAGSTGTLVKRDTAKICGVAMGKAGPGVALLGMFDVPDNRTVERN